MKETWFAATIEAKDDDVDLISHLMHKMGCNGIVEEASETVGQTRLTAYFKAEGFSKKTLKDQLEKIFSQYPALPKLTPQIATAGSNNWQNNWRQWFKPFEIVPGIIVAPSWENYAAKADEKVITLDPGMAFGTGLHETTRLCALEIHKLRSRHNSLLDVGTGSGLLAILASKMGIKKIEAVENDPEAVVVAEENFKINNVVDICVKKSLSDIKGTFDIVVANILLLTLIELKDELIKSVGPRGFLVLSGITNDQEDRIKQSFEPPLKLLEVSRQGEWSAITFRR